MFVLAWIGVAIALWTGQATVRPAHVSEGDRVEQHFRAYRERLDQFFGALRAVVTEQTPLLLPDLRDRPPQPVVYGYQMLPAIVNTPPSRREPVSSFSYSWPITESYVDGEIIKVSRAAERLREVGTAGDDEKPQLIAGLVREYRTLVQNQRTIDQYMQYNRFWQGTIAVDRARFDRLTALYDLMKSGQPDAGAAVREALGKPDAPDFIDVRRVGKDRIVLRVPVYTDIKDPEFLEEVKAIIEEMWEATGDGMSYAVEVELRNVKDLGPAAGDHIDLTAHAAKFPKNGAILTTGAQFTHSVVGRYVALGPGDLAPRTLAHEFGHVLGFRDGYIRGYRDLGERGFEILELTSTFDDIMSAPREGHVQVAHFKLLLDALK